MSAHEWLRWVRGGGNAHAYLYSSELALCGCRARRPPPDKERPHEEGDRCHNCVVAVDNIQTGREPITVLQRKRRDARARVLELEQAVLASVRAGGSVRRTLVATLCQADKELREAIHKLENNPPPVQRETRFDRRWREFEEEEALRRPELPMDDDEPEPEPVPEREPDPDPPCAPWIALLEGDS